MQTIGVSLWIGSRASDVGYFLMMNDNDDITKLKTVHRPQVISIFVESVHSSQPQSVASSDGYWVLFCFKTNSIVHMPSHAIQNELLNVFLMPSQLSWFMSCRPDYRPVLKTWNYTWIACTQAKFSDTNQWKGVYYLFTRRHSYQLHTQCYNNSSTDFCLGAPTSPDTPTYC